VVLLTTASHGTDQLMVQRLLSARTQAESRTALLASWVVILIQFTLFLLIGVMLFVFYTEQHLPSPQPPDRLYPSSSGSICLWASPGSSWPRSWRPPWPTSALR
jgi:Na+/proline symporter